MSKGTKGKEQVMSNLTWEHNIVEARMLSEKRAWFVAKFGLGLAFLAILAFLLSMPFRTIATRVVEVDKLTGETNFVRDMPAYVARPNDINDKYWIKKFVIAHERYDAKILQTDFDTVKVLSGDAVYTKYRNMFVGANALQTKLEDKVEIIPTILSITLPSKGIATVRYEVKTTDLKTLGKPDVARYVATLNYRYSPNPYAQEKDLIDNPLGFYVDSYIVDPEVAATTDTTPDTGAKVPQSGDTVAPTPAPTPATTTPATPAATQSGAMPIKPAVPAIGAKS